MQKENCDAGNLGINMDAEKDKKISKIKNIDALNILANDSDEEKHRKIYEVFKLSKKDFVALHKKCTDQWGFLLISQNAGASDDPNEYYGIVRCPKEEFN